MISLTIIMTIVFILGALTLVRFEDSDVKKGLTSTTSANNVKLVCFGFMAASALFGFAAVIMKILGA